MLGLRTLLAGALVLTGVMAYAAEDEDRSRVLINRYSGWSCTTDEAGDGWRCEGVRVDDDAAGALPEAAITDEAEDEVASESAAVSEPAAEPEPSAAPAAPLEIPETVVALRADLVPSVPLVVIRPGQLAATYWIDRDALTPGERHDLPAYCDGVYRLPTLPYAESPDNDALPVQAEADEAQYALDGEVVLEGNVIITQGTRSLHTARATVHQDTRNAELSGGVFILEPDVAMQGADADVNLENQAAQLNDAEFLLIDGAMRGTATSIAQDEVGNLVMGKNGFTRCRPGNA